MNGDDYKNRMVLLPAEAGTLAGDNIYFFSSSYNLLYKVHMPDFSVSIVSHIPHKVVNAFEWFRKMRYWNGKLILIPSYAEEIWIYGLDTGKWESIALDYPQVILKFWGSLIYQDYAFLFGEKYPVILKVNLNDHSVSQIKIDDWPKRKESGKGLFFTNAVRVNHMAFSPVSISNQVLRFNLDTSEYEWNRVGDEGNQYSGIDWNGYDFWISSGASGRIVKWNGNLKWEEFEVPKEIANRSYQFIGVICDEDKVKFLTQQDGKSVEIVNDNSCEVKLLMTKATKRYIHLESYENGTIVLMQSDAGTDVKWKGKWIKGICAINYEEFKSYFCDRDLWNIPITNGGRKETDIFRIDDFINIVARQKENPDKCIVGKNKGINIWETLKQF